MWQRMRTGSATKGARDYHWAMIEIKPDDTPEGHDDGHAFLLLRKHRYTGTISYYLCWSPQPVPLAKLIDVAVARWKIEENHQMSKQVTGLDSGQVTTWTSWHRCTAISLSPRPSWLPQPPGSAPASNGSTAALRLIPITVPELLRQLRGTVIPWLCRVKAHPRRLDPLATPPPVPRLPGPPALARLRGQAAATVTNYNCRNSGSSTVTTCCSGC